MDFPVQDAKTDPHKKAESNRARRKVLQQQYEEDYQQALITLKEKYDLKINYKNYENRRAGYEGINSRCIQIMVYGT
jgi:hypothetical protein